MSFVAAHQSVDWDAIASLYALSRFWNVDFAVHEIRLFNLADPQLPDTLADAYAVVDMGRELDVARLRFDHHQDATNLPSAAWLVYAAAAPPDGDPDPVYRAARHIFDLISRADRGMLDPDVVASKKIGIHALLSQRKTRGDDDVALIAWGFDVLDLLIAGAARWEQAAQELSQRIMLHDPDTQFVALYNGSALVSTAAFEAGARLVLFVEETTPGTVAVGVRRAPESTIDCRVLLQYILDLPPSDPTIRAAQAEIRTWYQHDTGFFAGRGTAKSRDPRPLDLPPVDLAQVVQRAFAAIIHEEGA